MINQSTYKSDILIQGIWYKGAIKLQYVSTNEQVVDVMTKRLSLVNFEYLCDKLGVIQKDIPCKEEQ